MNKVRKNVLYPELSYFIVGLCYKIHNELGRYRNEQEYADALEMLLRENKIRYNREAALNPSFIGEKKQKKYSRFYY